jgi:hypothetical protein
VAQYEPRSFSCLTQGAAPDPFPRGEGNSRQTSQSREPPRDARSGKTPCQTPCQQGVWLVRHVHALASEHVQRRFGRSRAPARFGRPCPSPRCRPNMESASATRPALLSADTVGASRATSARFNLRERSQQSQRALSATAGGPFSGASALRAHALPCPGARISA